MKNYCILLLTVFFSSTIFAQNMEEQKYLLTTHTNTFGLSTLSFIDPYLSPLTYSGMGIRYESVSRRFLSPENTNISMQSKLNLEAAVTENPATTSSMNYLGINYSWGLHYHFRPREGLRLLAGALLDADLGIKDVPRNVNNPVNMDMNTNLNLSGIAMYDVFFWKRTFTLQLTMQTPVMGCMFVPGSGASYYEMFELGNLKDAIHFSSLHNKRGLNSAFTIAVPFNRSVWRFGCGLNLLNYSANDMVFRKNEFTFTVGTTFDMVTFGGRKNKAPRNFITTNN